MFTKSLLNCSCHIMGVMATSNRNHITKHVLTYYTISDDWSRMLLTFVHDLKLRVNNSSNTEIQSRIKVTVAGRQNISEIRGVCCILLI